MGKYHQRSFRFKCNPERLRFKFRRGFRSSETFPSSSSILQQTNVRCNGGSHFARSRQNVDERGHRVGSRPEFFRLLQPDFSGAQAGWRDSAGDRLVNAERVSTDRNVQDGDHELYYAGIASRGMDHVHRSEGCVLPYSDRQAVKEVPPFCTQREVLPVSGPSVRAGSGPFCVYNGHERGGGICTYARDKSAHVFGRLVSLSDGKAKVGRADSLAFGFMSLVRPVAKYPEIQSCSPARLCISGNQVPDGSVSMSAIARQVETFVGSSQNISERSSSVSEKLDESHRLNVLHELASSVGTSASSTVADTFPEWLEPAPSIALTEDQGDRSGQSPTVVVGSACERDDWSNVSSVQNGANCLHGRVQRGLGSSRERSDGIWDVASIMAVPPDKLAGVAGYSASAGSFSTSCSEQTCAFHVRQQNCCSICKQARGNPVQTAVCSGSSHLSVVSQTKRQNFLPIHSRAPQCKG